MSEQSKVSVKRIIISAIALVAAFILTKLLLQGMIYFLSHEFEYAPTFSFTSIHNSVRDWQQWSRARVFIIDMVPMVVCLLFGIGLYLVMRRQTNSWGYLQFFGYWMMVCLVNNFLAQFLFAPLGVDDTNSSFYQTMAVMEAWLHLPTSLAAALSVFAILFTAATGYLLSAEILKLSHSQRLVTDSSGKNSIIFQLYLLPLVLASLPLIFLGKGDYALPLAAAIINLALFPVGMFLRNSRGPYRVRFQKTEVGTAFMFVALTLTSVLWIGVYVYLR